MCIYKAGGPGRGSKCYLFFNEHKVVEYVISYYSLDSAIRKYMMCYFVYPSEEFKRYPENFNEVLESFTKTIHACVACEYVRWTIC